MTYAAALYGRLKFPLTLTLPLAFLISFWIKTLPRDVSTEVLIRSVLLAKVLYILCLAFVWFVKMEHQAVIMSDSI